MNHEAYGIRKKINGLKARLIELETGADGGEDSSELCASSVCGHDEIVANLRKMCRTFEHSSRAVVAAWEQMPGSSRTRWFSTTVYPETLPYHTRTPRNVSAYLAPLAVPGAFDILEFLFSVRTPQTEKSLSRAQHLAGCEARTLEALTAAGHIQSDTEGYSLTMKGWQSYIVLAHLTNVLDLKLEAAKAIKVSEAISAVYSVDWGEYLGRALGEVVEDLTAAGWMARLRQAGIDESDIEKAVYEYNAPLSAVQP